MDSRLSLIDLNCQLIFMQYGSQNTIEELFELLTKEFPTDKITFEELTMWASMMWDVESLERSFEECYEKYGVENQY